MCTRHSLRSARADLHWGNLLVSKAPRSSRTLSLGALDGEWTRVVDHGVRVTLIDFTLSRLTTESGVLCTRLDELQDDWLFSQRLDEGDLQVSMPTFRLCCMLGVPFRASDSRFVRR